MKLHNLVAFLSEAIAEDDPFGPQKPLGVSLELIQRLEQQEHAVYREMWHTKEGLYGMLDQNGVRFWSTANYPGGSSQAKKDSSDKKVVQITVDRDWGKGRTRRGRVLWSNKTTYFFPNTPAGLELLHKVTERMSRVYNLIAREDKIHAKLLRDRRTVADRTLKARQATARDAANARFGKNP